MTYTPNPTDPTNPTLAIGAGTAASEFQALKLYEQSFLSRRNLLLNGAFRVAQMGTTFTIGAATGVYTLDQWVWLNVTGSTVVTQANPNPGDFALLATQNSSSTGGELFQSIEAIRCNKCINEATVTVSGKINASTATNLTITPIINAAGAINNFSSVNLIGTGAAISLVAATLVSFEQQIVLTGSGLTGLQLLFQVTGSGNASSTILFKELQLEVNQFPTPFEFLPYSTDLSECQRFFQWFGITQARYLQTTGAFNDVYALPIAMRTAPTIGVQSHTGKAVTGSITSAFIFGQQYLTLPFTQLSAGDIIYTYGLNLSCQF